MEIFSFESGLIFWTAISFLALLLLLKFFALNPLLDILRKREDRIRESIEETERARKEAERLLQEYRKQLAEARKEAQRIIDRNKELGESAKKEIIEEATHQAQYILEQAREEIEWQKGKAIEELQKESADLIIAVASKVMEKSLDEKSQSKLIEKYINEVKGL